MSRYPSIISQPGSAQRNLQPVTDALTPLIQPSKAGESSKQPRILELASHPYEHISSFAERWPDVEWWGTCRDETEISDVMERLAESRRQGQSLDNLRRPEQLDVSRDEDWAALSHAVDRAVEPGSSAFEGVIMLNLIHCCPVDVPENIFKHLSPTSSTGKRLLDPRTGWIAAYGAYKNDDGTYKSEGDEEFDRTYIKAKDPSLGLRAIKSITAFAEKWGFVEESRRDMPKGNMFIVWRARF